MHKKVKTYGIICASMAENSNITNILEPPISTIDIGPRRFTKGFINGKEVIVVISGDGMTNATLTTQLLIDKFDLDGIFYIGIAGLLNIKYKHGDILIAKNWAEYQYQKLIRFDDNINLFIDNDINFPNKFYRVNDKIVALTRPSCENCNSININGQTIKNINDDTFVSKYFAIPMESPIIRNIVDTDLTIPQQFWFPVNKKLLSYAKKVSLCKIKLQPIDDKIPDIHIVENGISSQSFVDNIEYRKRIHKIFNADLVDMESAAFIHTCETNNIPGIIIRGMSDLIGFSSKEAIDALIDVVSRNNIIIMSEILKIIN